MFILFFLSSSIGKSRGKCYAKVESLKPRAYSANDKYYSLTNTAQQQKRSFRSADSQNGQLRTLLKFNTNSVQKKELLNESNVQKQAKKEKEKKLVRAFFACKTTVTQ